MTGSTAVLGVCLVAIALAAPSATAAAEPRTLVVLDIEILGDLGDPSLAESQDVRRRRASERLRERLHDSGLYRVADNAPAQEMIDRLASVQYLHKCNGCELDIAQALGAEAVLVAWVNRVSLLILSLNYEIRNARTGEAERRGSFDFRGDNDAAWSHAVDYLVRDLKARR